MTFKKIASVTTSLVTVLSMTGVAAVAPMAMAADIVDGDIIKTATNPDVYIVKLVGSKMFKRLILNPQVFESYGHLKWENIEIVTQAEMDMYTTSELVRADGDTKVYKLTPDGDTGSKQWIETAEAFLAAGYDWDAIYTINSVDLGNYSGGSTTTPTTGLSVAVASNTPAAASLPAAANHVEFAKFTFTGNGTISTIAVTRGGVGATGDFANVYLYDGNTRLTNGRTINSSSNQATFTSLNLAVNGSRTITVVADISGTSGNQNYISIAAASDISATTGVSGNFPVRGNTMTLAGSSAGTITIAKSGSISAPFVGQSQAPITKVQLSAATEDMVLKTLTFYNGGNLTGSSITNLNLQINGTTVATGTGFDSNSRGLVTFTGNGYTLTKGTNLIATLYADLGGRPDDTIKLYVENDVDVYAIGNTYGFGAQVTRSSFNGTGTSVSHNLTLDGGQLTIAYNGPSAATVGTDTNDTVLLDFSLTAAAELEVRQMRFYICYIDTVAATMELAEDEIEDIKIIDKNSGVTLMGPVDGSSWTSSESASQCSSSFTGGETYYTFTDSFTLVPGETRNLQMTVDIKSVDDLDATDIIAGLLYNPASLSNSVRYTSSNTYLAAGDVVPSTNIEGNQMTLGASSLSVALGTSPTGAKTYVKGNTLQDAAQFLFTAGTASDMTLTDLTLTGYVKDESGGTWTAGKETSGDSMYAKDLVSNVYLYDGSTLVAGPKSFSGTDYQDVVFTGLSVNVPAGTQKALNVKIDLTNTSASGTYDYVNFDIDATTDVSATDEKGNTVNPSSVDPNNSPTVYVLKASNGSLAVTADDAYRPLKSAIHMSQDSVEMSKFRFTASTEAFTVQTLQLEIDETADRTNIESLSISYPTQNGGTSTATGYFGSTASVAFSGLNFYVPKDAYAYLTVYANMKAYTEGADSGDDFSIDFDGDGTANTIFKAVGSGGTVIAADHAGIVDRDGNNMYLYRSYPKLEFLSSPAGGTTSSLPTTLMKFTITNKGEFDLVMDSTSGSIGFEVVASGAETGNATFTLYDDATGQTLDAATITTPGAEDNASATFDFTTLGTTLTAGATKTYRIDITSGKSLFDENGDYLQIVLRDEAGVLKWDDEANAAQIQNTAAVNGLGYPALNTPQWTIAGL